jgi:hypothetical protein
MPLIKVDNNKKKEKKINYDFCFVCYEIKIPNEKKPLSLKTQKYYIKRCTCDGLIHKYCLDIWYSTTKICPICREYMCDIETFKTVFVTNIANNDANNDANNEVNNEANNEANRPTMLYLFYIKKSKYKITKFIIILGLLFCIYNFYISIINFSYAKYIKNEDI